MRRFKFVKDRVKGSFCRFVKYMLFLGCKIELNVMKQILKLVLETVARIIFRNQWRIEILNGNQGRQRMLYSSVVPILYEP